MAGGRAWVLGVQVALHDMMARLDGEAVWSETTVTSAVP
jgi:hypothetical protein